MYWLNLILDYDIVIKALMYMNILQHVVFVAQRRILAKPTRKANKLKQKRPRSRTLVAVHEEILNDMVYPAEIVGKRIRIRLVLHTNIILI